MRVDARYQTEKAELAKALALLEGDPSNTQHQRGVGIGHEKLGDVLKDQGDLGAALSHFQEKLAISQRLAQRDPSNTEHQRGVGIGHERVGNVLKDQGDLGAALSHFQESLEISQRLAQHDPSNFALQCDINVSRLRIAEVREREGKPQAALDNFLTALESAETLSRISPKHEQNNRIVAYCTRKRIALLDQLREGGILEAPFDLANNIIDTNYNAAKPEPQQNIIDVEKGQPSRNALCVCGSGKKHKHCCGKLT